MFPRRYDPLMWCVLCFLIAIVGFWWPFLAAQADGPDSRIGFVCILTGPFVVFAGIRAIFACRKLIIVAKPPEKLPPALCALGFLLAAGSVLPMAWLLFVFIYGMFAFR
jgi:hypothetical protein